MKTIPRTLAGGTTDTFAERMLRSREHARIDRKTAADKIGLSVSQLGRVERGGRHHGL